MIANQNDFYNQLGDFIKEARTRADVSQEALAKILNLSRISIVNIEKGRQKIQIHTLIEIVYYLDIPPGDFFEKLKSALKHDIGPNLEKEINKKADSQNFDEIAKLKGFISYTRLKK